MVPVLPVHLLGVPVTQGGVRVSAGAEACFELLGGGETVGPVTAATVTVVHLHDPAGRWGAAGGAGAAGEAGEASGGERSGASLGA